MTHILNTHSHGDRQLGNIAFAESTVIGSERCRELVVKTGDEWVYLMESLAGRSFPNAEPVSAGTVCPTLSRTSVMLHGAHSLFCIQPGSHVDADLMISLPDDTVPPRCVLAFR